MNNVNNTVPAKFNLQQSGSKALDKKNDTEFSNVLKDTINKVKSSEQKKKLEDPNKNNLENQSNEDEKEQQPTSDNIGLVTIKDGALVEIPKVQTCDSNIGLQDNLVSNLGLIGLVGQGNQVIQEENIKQKIQNVLTGDAVVDITGINAELNKATKVTLNEQQLPPASNVNTLPNQTSSESDSKSIGAATANVQGLKQSESPELMQLTKQENKTLEKAETTETTDSKLPNELGITLKTESLDLSKVNIKVADGANLNKQALPNQIADKIIFNANNGKQEFDIQLYPKELGKIGIKLVFEGNEAQILVSCSNPKTQSLMAIHADGLKNILEANTGMQATVSVQDESGLMGQNQRESFDGRGESQSRSQQENSKHQSIKDEENISFLNQLKFGLLEQNALL